MQFILTIFQLSFLLFSLLSDPKIVKLTQSLQHLRVTELFGVLSPKLFMAFTTLLPAFTNKCTEPLKRCWGVWGFIPIIVTAAAAALGLW